MTTEAAKAAKAKYDAKTAKYVSIKLNRNTDKDIIERLEDQKTTQGYIKSLIRADVHKAASGCKPFRKAPGKYSCGCCGTELTGKPRYCGNCGQPILWAK